MRTATSIEVSSTSFGSCLIRRHSEPEGLELPVLEREEHRVEQVQMLEDSDQLHCLSKTGVFACCDHLAQNGRHLLALEYSCLLMMSEGSPMGKRIPISVLMEISGTGRGLPSFV